MADIGKIKDRLITLDNKELAILYLASRIDNSNKSNFKIINDKLELKTGQLLDTLWKVKTLLGSLGPSQDEIRLAIHELSLTPSLKCDNPDEEHIKSCIYCLNQYVKETKGNWIN